MKNMGLLDNINNRIFNRVSKNSTVGSSVGKHSTYTTLFQRKDTTVPYDIGVKILRDTQVSTGFDIIKYLLSSKQWILTDAEENTDSEIFDFINDMLHNMGTELNTVVKQMLSAILWGFSVHEILFDVVDGLIVVQDVLPIHIKTLQQEPFVYDDDGNLIAIHQVSRNGEVDIPINKCLLYSYNSLYDEKEGHGLLYDFLPIVEDKENTMDWLMTYAEKNENPTLYGKTSNPASRDELLYAFEDISDGTTGLVIGAEDEVGVLESSHRGETFFDILQYKDNQIFRRMFIGNLLLGDNSQTGTYAQSKTQFDFTTQVYDGILEEIANIFQMQVINPIVEFNYGAEVKPPVISFDKFSSGDMEKLFNIIKPLMDNGTLDSENSAVQESLALLFKSEAGVEYTNNIEPITENYNYQPTPIESEALTENIISDLDGITRQTD